MLVQTATSSVPQSITRFFRRRLEHDAEDSYKMRELCTYVDSVIEMGRHNFGVNLIYRTSSNVPIVDAIFAF